MLLPIGQVNEEGGSVLGEVESVGPLILLSGLACKQIVHFSAESCLYPLGSVLGVVPLFG